MSILQKDFGEILKMDILRSKYKIKIKYHLQWSLRSLAYPFILFPGRKSLKRKLKVGLNLSSSTH